ncbi:MAG: acyl-CoA dehydrogenase family protein [Sandaracinaceae bacterium]|nr:acyl-CoA dehydrogenase family protein [Sandaracinaceae bacterium]
MNYPVESAFVNGTTVAEVFRRVDSIEKSATQIEAHASSAAAALKALVKHFGENDLLSFAAPESGSHANVDMSVALCLMRERLAYISPLADLAFAMQGLGSFPILLGGSPELTQEWLPRVRRGDAVAAFALTEPNAGSDVGGMETTAVESGDFFVLNGEKVFISNAGVADFYSLFAVTDASGEKKRLSCFVVPAHTEGLSVRAVDVLGAHPIGDLSLKNVRVPKKNLIGAAGDGMRIALGTLERFRPTVAAAALGFAARALDDTIAHVKSRKQFGKALAEQQLVQAHLADMACDVESSRLLVYRAAVAADQKKSRHEIARTGSMAKLMSTEAAQRVIDCAVQLHGGRGVATATHVARLYQDIRALRIYEGTSEIQKLLIAREVLRP